MVSTSERAEAAVGAERHDWERLARTAKIRRRVYQGALVVFLVVTSLPIILPYLMSRFHRNR